ncbi:MAG TPA: hypothetical protein VFR79_04980 [Nitrospira sp.]|nr:hypothetical protein [Nitrospira sp.]
MALEAVRHVAGAMGAAAFCPDTPNLVVIQDSGGQAERRLKHMACGARSGSGHGEDKVSMRVLRGMRCDVRESAPMFRMTGYTRVLLPNELLMEGCR